MKKYLIAAAITAALTASASAADFVCGAPRVALGDNSRDNNPVVNVEVRHNPDDHSWRIFHILRNGLIVSRSEQYSILDASGSGRTQWRGSLNRQRNLYMIGEIKVDDAGEFGYMEWLYDRNKNNRLVMQSVADCAKATPIPNSDDDGAGNDDLPGAGRHQRRPPQHPQRSRCQPRPARRDPGRPDRDRLAVRQAGRRHRRRRLVHGELERHHRLGLAGRTDAGARVATAATDRRLTAATDRQRRCLT